MSQDSRVPKSALEDQASLAWAFLDTEDDPCAVLSERMELVYTNAAWRRMLPAEWYAKRCFEVFPVSDGECALHCSTLEAVSQSKEVFYADESWRREDGATYQFGLGLIPLGEAAAPPAKVILLLRRKDELHDEAFRRELIEDAKSLKARVDRAL